MREGGLLRHWAAMAVAGGLRAARGGSGRVS